MATTLTGLVVSASGGILIVHTGDSRAYRLRDGHLTRQTRDDSLVQALVDRGIIAPHEAATHPRRNIVTASLGGGVDDGVSVAPADAAPGDRWLLCSDGVSDYLPDDAIAEQLATHGDAGAAASAVVTAALDAGTRDNVTAVVCDILDGEVVNRGVVEFYGAAAARFSERLDAAG
jgi:protein phosphatase